MSWFRRNGNGKNGNGNGSRDIVPPVGSGGVRTLTTAANAQGYGEPEEQAGAIAAFGQAVSFPQEVKGVMRNLGTSATGADKGVSGLTERKMLEILADRVPLSDFLTWLHAENFKDYTLFETSEGVGFGFEVFVPSFMGDTFEDEFKQIFSIAFPVDSIIQFFCYASENIKPYIDLYRKIHSHTPDVRHPEILHEMICKRADFFEKAAHDGFWDGVPFRPRYFRNVLTILIPYASLKGDVEKTYEITKTMALRVKGNLDSMKLHPMKLTADSLISLMREIFNADYRGSAMCDENRDIRDQIIDHNVKIDIVDDQDGNSDIRVRQNKREKFIRVFNISKFPQKMTLWEFSNILFSWKSKEESPALSSPFGFSLSVKYTDWEKTKVRLQTKATWNMKQAENNILARYVPRISRKADESKYVMELVEEGAFPLPSYFAFFLVETSQSRLEHLSYEVLSKFRTKQFEFQREIDKGAVSLFLDMLPLNHISERDKFLNKRSTLFHANIATMIPWIAGVYGASLPIELYVDRKGQMTFFDRFSSTTNFNVTKIAESGGGKSFSQGNSHVHSLTAGRKIRVIDVGRSYEPFCKTIGGEYIEMTGDPCFNFFTNALVKCPVCNTGNPFGTDRCVQCTSPMPSKDWELAEDEMDSIVPLVGFLCGYDVSDPISKPGQDNISARVSSVIVEAVSEAFRQKVNSAGMEEIGKVFSAMKDEVGDNLPRQLYQALKPYSEGPYRRYFNGRNNISYSSDYVVAELQEVEHKDPRLQAAIIFSVIIKILREVYIGWKLHKQTYELDVDEAWSILKKITAKSALESFARRMRKYDSSLGILTQGIDDAYQNETTRAIWENSAHKIYLQMKPTTIEKAIEEKKLVMDDFATEWFKTLSTIPHRYSEIYFNSPACEGVVRLVVDLYSYGIFTTSGKEKKKLEALQGRLNTDIGGVLKILTEREQIGAILMRLGVKPLAIELARRYQMEQKMCLRIGEILVQMGACNEETLQEALKNQEEQLTWDYVFSGH